MHYCVLSFEKKVKQVPDAIYITELQRSDAANGGLPKSCMYHKFDLASAIFRRRRRREFMRLDEILGLALG